MSRTKAEYVISPTSVVFKPSQTGRTTDLEQKDYRGHVWNRHNLEPGLLSHSDMSWGSTEDRYILDDTTHIKSYETLSIASSSTDSSSHSSMLHERDSVSGDDEKRQCIIESNWGGYGLDVQLWKDNLSPIVKIRNFNEMLFDDIEFWGFLTDRLVGVGSSFLTKSPENGLFVLSKCVLREMSISDIRILHYHRYLQYIDLVYNNISDLSPLGGIPYLIYLNMEHNKVKHVFNFTPPWYLTYVNLSFNHISKMDDFSSFWSITRLNLSHNAIEVISGLQNLKYLQNLDLSYNLIECIENLDKLNIQELNLEGNCITSYRSATPGHGLNTLPNLRTIMLAYNRLSSLEFFKDAHWLRIIDLKFNKINDLLEVSHIAGSVQKIDLRGNSCTKWPNYRDVLLFSIPTIIYIDGTEVSTAEKVSAATLFASPLDLLAARTITKLTLLEQLNAPRIDTHVIPYDEIGPPLIVLIGPSAVKKACLALQIAYNIPKKVRYCRWYTTREVENEEEHQSYIFVSREEFNDIARKGEFLAVQELLGNSYGFHHEEITQLILEKRIGITQMDLHTALAINKRYSNMKPILVVTKSEDIHRLWIQEKFNIYTWIKDSLENLLAVKIGKRKNNDVLESEKSTRNFINEILDEIIDGLELPSYGLFVRPQGTGATTTDIILESKTMLPKVILRRSEVELMDRRRVSIETDDTDNLQKFPDDINLEPKYRSKGLKVLLDEGAIIVEDQYSKRIKQQEKKLRRRNTFEMRKLNCPIIEEPDDSISSAETYTEPRLDALRIRKSPEYVKAVYSELVLKSRDIYLDYHTNNPGFFSLVLLTDQYVKSFNTLSDFIFELYVTHSSRKPIFQPEIKYFKGVAIPEAANTIANEIKESLSTSVLQRKKLLRIHGITSWNKLMPSQIAQI